MSQTETTQTPTVDQLQKLHRRRMALFGLVILIAGIAIGAAFAVILIPRQEPLRGPDDPVWSSLMMAGRLEHVLDLTPEQKEKIRLISKTAFDALHAIQKKAKPDIEKIVEDMNKKISDALTPEQRLKWQQELEEFKRRFREGWRRGGRRPSEGGPGSGRRRGPDDPNRSRRGPGWRPDDPNRPWNGPRQGPGDPNRPRDSFRRGPGSFGPGFDPDDPNRPPRDFGRGLNSAPPAAPNRIEE